MPDSENLVSRDEFLFSIGIIFLRYDTNQGDQVFGDGIAPATPATP